MPSELLQPGYLKETRSFPTPTRAGCGTCLKRTYPNPRTFIPTPQSFLICIKIALSDQLLNTQDGDLNFVMRKPLIRIAYRNIVCLYELLPRA